MPYETMLYDAHVIGGLKQKGLTKLLFFIKPVSIGAKDRNQDPSLEIWGVGSDDWNLNRRRGDKS
jgi:hypothetical protein